MGFWSWLVGEPNHAGELANPNPPTSVGPDDWRPGDPDGVTFDGFDEQVERRSLPVFYPSPWSGWPAEWSTPQWDFGSRFNELVDIAWSCLDLNTSVLSSMPVYRMRAAEIIEPVSWMLNPDPMVYTSWHEFAKQLFWDYLNGEAFVLPMSFFSDGYPMRFRVVPPWAFHVEMRDGQRRYTLGGVGGTDVTDDVLHIRYRSTSDQPRGVGPLEAAGGRMLTAGVLARYAREIVQTGGVPVRTIETDAALDPDDAQDLMNQYMAARVQNSSAPPVFDNGAKLVDHPAVSPRDMAMLELAQFTEARIAVLLGVPPFLVGLPSGGSESMTYSNVSQVFDFHDRASLRPKASAVMAALSNWALPGPQKAELNRDEYTRPPFEDRAEAWVKLVAAGIVRVDEARTAERLQGAAPTLASSALTGGE
jgi:HK97 family phage portal protein